MKFELAPVDAELAASHPARGAWIEMPVSRS